MFKKNRAGMLSKKSLLITISSILLLYIVFVAGQCAVPAHADDETELDVNVTVSSASEESYGGSIAALSRVLLPWRALGEPDGRGAWMYRRGWVSIELKDTVTNCSDVSVWLAKRGWRSPGFKVYASADGNNWTYIGGGKCTSRSYTRYDFSGASGDVKYIKVKRRGSGRWSMMLLDAVRAKGGHA